MNVLIVEGRVTRDSEARPLGKYTKTVFTVEVKGDSYTNKAGERMEEVTWLQVEKFGETPYHAGDIVRCVGKLRIDGWADKVTGEKKSKAYMAADTVKVIKQSVRQVEASIAAVDDYEG